ncbi:MULTISPECIES: DUF2474 domain-containing protein [Cupriavidus]|uniref:DUF2474 domain-containing protein n=1 Tax=Cupriavidus TaxID=106589 RepID=UPI0009F379DA|nr:MULTISPECIES: DUF2474 domain-containing protein [Cupriavidus]
MDERAARRETWRRRWRQAAWMVGLWAGGVVSVALVAELIRLAMQAAGMKSH